MIKLYLNKNKMEVKKEFLTIFGSDIDISELIHYQRKVRHVNLILLDFVDAYMNSFYRFRFFLI